VDPSDHLQKFEVGSSGGMTVKMYGKGLSGWESSTAAPINEGCFSGQLPVRRGSWGNMTVAFCMSLCSGYRYFGVANRFQCSCGNASAIEDLQLLRQSQSQCNALCGGDIFQKCGGSKDSLLHLWERCCFPSYRIGGYPARHLNASIDGTSIELEVPSHTEQSAVAWEMKFATVQKISIPHKLNYNNEITPIIRSVVPSRGYAGQNITIRGTRLANCGNRVQIGGAQCDVLREDSENIVCKLGAGNVGVLSPPPAPKDAPKPSSYTSCLHFMRYNPGAENGNIHITTPKKTKLEVYCDFQTDGGGYTFMKVYNGRRTRRHTDRDTCKDYGLQMMVPRTKKHFEFAISKFGSHYFSVVPGITRHSSVRKSYVGTAMRWSQGRGSLARDWKAIDGGSWWLRDTPFGEPNGDYSANCWLRMYGFTFGDFRSNDAGCRYSTNDYICSTNDKDDAILLAGHQMKVTVPSVGSAALAQCMFEPGIIRDGSNLWDGKHHIARSKHQCCDWCISHPECVAYTFEKKTGQCWVKKSPGKAHANSGFDSAFVQERGFSYLQHVDKVDIAAASGSRNGGMKIVMQGTGFPKQGEKYYGDLMDKFSKLNLRCQTDGTGTGATSLMTCEAGSGMKEGSVPLSSISDDLPNLHFSNAATPTVNAVAPRSGTPGIILTISGTGFAAPFNHVGNVENWTASVSVTSQPTTNRTEKWQSRESVGSQQCGKWATPGWRRDCW
jgi:hypothetical protein